MELDNIKKTIQHPFVKDVAFMQGGTIFNTIIKILASIFFARLLLPEKYGIYGLVFSFAALIGLFMDVGAPYAVLTLCSKAYVEKNKQEIKNLLTFFLKITLLVSGSIGILAILLAPYLSQLLYQSWEIGQLARLVILAIIIEAVFALVMIVLQVTRKIKRYVLLSSAHDFLDSFLAVIFIVLGWGVFGVAFAWVLASIIILIISVFIYRSLARQNEYWPRLKEIFYNFKNVALKKYFLFGFSIAVAKNTAGLFTLLPILILGYFVLPENIAYYKIAFAYTTIPLMLLGQVSQLLNVQFPQTQIYGLEFLRKKFFQVSFYSFLIALGLVVPLVLLAPFLVKLVYGPDYLKSIPLVYYLSIYTLLAGLGVALGPLYRTMNKMGTAIIINILAVIIGLPVVFFLIRTYFLMGAVYSVILLIILPLVPSMIMANKYLKHDRKTI